MARTTTNLLAISAVALFLLLARGVRLTLGRDVAILLLAWAAAAAVSVLGSGSVYLSLLRLELYLSVALLGIVVYLVYRDQENLPLEAYFLAIAVVHLPFLLSAVFWIKADGPPFWSDGPRLAHFANYRQFAEFSFLAAVSATGLGILSRRLVVPSFLLSAAALFGIIMTASRGAALSWVLFVLLACLLSQARVRAAIHGVLVLASAAGLVWYLDHTGRLLSPKFSPALPTSSLEMRAPTALDWKYGSCPCSRSRCIRCSAAARRVTGFPVAAIAGLCRRTILCCSS